MAAGAAALGAAGLATRAIAARKRAQSGSQLVDPYWFYVATPTEVYGLEDYENVVGQFTPGAWYLAKATYEEWVHAHDDVSGLEGWVAKQLAVRQPQ